MKKSRIVTVGQTVLIMAMVCLLMPTDTRAQFQASTLSSPSFAFRSGRYAGSTTDTMTTELRLPSARSATNLSLAFTLIPVGVGLAMATSGNDPGLGVGLAGFGLFIGPSIGYFYGGCTDARPDRNRYPVAGRPGHRYRCGCRLQC